MKHIYKLGLMLGKEENPLNYKITMTLYFEDFKPEVEAMRLVEEADCIRIENPVEITDQQLQEEMQYD